MIELMTSDAITSYDVMLSITPLNIPTRDSKLIAGISFMLAATPQYLNGLKYPIRSLVTSLNILFSLSFPETAKEIWF